MHQMWKLLVICSGLSLCAANTESINIMRRESVGARGEVLTHAPKKSRPAPKAMAPAKPAAKATPAHKATAIAKPAAKVAQVNIKKQHSHTTHRALPKKVARKSKLHRALQLYRAGRKVQAAHEQSQAHKRRHAASMVQKQPKTDATEKKTDASPKTEDQAELAKPSGNLTEGPADVLPEEGGEYVLTKAEDFGKNFVISFKVKFNDLAKSNYQMLAGTDEHTLLIQLLGPKEGANSGKIAAWMKTDSQLGPHSRGVTGSDGTGMLLSHTIKKDRWYDVKLQKTSTKLTLTVDGGVDGTTPDKSVASSTINRNVIIHLPQFDLERGNKKVTFGKKFATGEYSLDGQIGDISVVEGA